MSTTKRCWKDLVKESLNSYLLPGEKAKAILGYEDYFITSKGRVFSSKTSIHYKTLNNTKYGCVIWKELKPFLAKGYYRVTLSNKKMKKNCYIHDLVFTQFVGEYSKYYFRIKHINKKKLDNRLENLTLEFRRKDREFLDEYEYHKKFISHLNDYSRVTLDI